MKYNITDNTSNLKFEWDDGPEAKQNSNIEEVFIECIDGVITGVKVKHKELDKKNGLA